MKRIIVAVTGATGAIYGLRLLEMLRELPEWESHLIISKAGLLNIQTELDISSALFEAAADVVHNVANIGASIASGSFITDGMIVAPCSMRTLAAIAQGYSDNLVTRAADVVIKERRRLVLMTRETPLNLAHLRNMAAITEMGGIIAPPAPAFYFKPTSLDDIINHSCTRILDLFGIVRQEARRWEGIGRSTGH